MKSFAVINYRMRGTKEVLTERFDLNNPEQRIAWEQKEDSLRSKYKEPLTLRGPADYFVTSFELVA